MRTLQPVFVLSIIMVSALHITTNNGSAQSGTPTVAVIEFKSSGGLSVGEMRTLTNRFRDMLVQTDSFTVIERDEMETIFREQDFVLSDNCNSADCAVEVGRVLGAEKMIAGDVGRLGDTWTTSLRLIDVTSGKILKAQTGDHTGRVDGLLEVMRRIAFVFAETEIPHDRGTVITHSEIITAKPGRFRISMLLGLTPNEKTTKDTKRDFGVWFGVDIGYLVHRNWKLSGNVSYVTIPQDNAVATTDVRMLAAGADISFYVLHGDFRPFAMVGGGTFRRTVVDVNTKAEDKSRGSIVRMGGGLEADLSRTWAATVRYSYNRMPGHRLHIYHAGLILQFGKASN